MGRLADEPQPKRDPWIFGTPPFPNAPSLRADAIRPYDHCLLVYTAADRPQSRHNLTACHAQWREQHQPERFARKTLVEEWMRQWSTHTIW